MEKLGVNSIGKDFFTPQVTKVKQPKGDFSEMLKNAVNNVNEAQLNSDLKTSQLARGGNVELHEVMIASTKANITLQATLEVRNKVIDAYKEVMRMQI